MIPNLPFQERGDREGDAVVTISAKNDFHRVMHLYESVRKYHKEVRFFWCLYGTSADQISPEDVNFLTLTVEDFAPDLNPLFWYDVVSGATYIKPYCLLTIMGVHQAKRLLFFDPDIYIMHPLDHMFSWLRKYSFLLTPHFLRPFPNDGKHPTSLDILASGTYNFGFLGIANSKTAKNFLVWWKEMLYRQSFAEPEKLQFTDQRWGDFIPSTFGDALIIRSLAYNIAWWNLHERGHSIHQKQGDWYVDDERIVFYHFSGFNYKKPDVLSRHTTRVFFDNFTILADLYQRYAGQIQKSFTRFHLQSEVPFNRFSNGFIKPWFFARQMADLCEKQLEKFGDPFDTSLSSNVNASVLVFDSMFENICNPKGTLPHLQGDGYIPRVLEYYWYARNDLMEAFPRICSDESYLDWVMHHVEDTGLNALYLDWIESKSATRNKAKSCEIHNARIGVVGHFHGHFGISESTGLLYDSIRLKHDKTIPIHVEHEPSHKYSSPHQIFKGSKPDIIIYHLNADTICQAFEDENVKRAEKENEPGIRIAFFYWELSVFPPDKVPGCIRSFDEVWVATSFAEKAMASVLPVPVFRVNQPFPTLKFQETPQNTHVNGCINRNSGFFFFNFDYLSIHQRKNPDGLLDAYLMAFPHDSTSTPCLLIKSSNIVSDAHKSHWELLKMKAQGCSHISFFSGTLPVEEVHYLMKKMRGYISLHRSEGFGLGPLKSLLLGKPVIVTGYSGNMDFTNTKTSFLVKYRLVPIPPDAHPYSDVSHAIWAEPNLTHASQLIKYVVSHQIAAKSMGLHGKKFVSERYSPEITGKHMLKRLEYLLSCC